MVPAWNGEETGIENIRFNLGLQGVEAARIPALTEDIIDFTELGAFIFHPVKTYSTGMSARLSFAIATAIEPEILIIDEVLSTGDGYFAWKAYQRMKQFCARGRALLFVSHSLAAVQQMCDTVVWLQNGSVRLKGEASYVLRQYELDFRRLEDLTMRSRQSEAALGRSTTAAPDEVKQTSQVRFRIGPTKGGQLFATHYVRAIRVTPDQSVPIEIPLELADPDAIDNNGALDVLSSEWGRIQERAGYICRILSRNSGRNSGGQFVTRLSPCGLPVRTAFELEIEAATTDVREALALDMLDMRTGSWMRLKQTAATSAGGDWRRLCFRGVYERVEEGQSQEVVAAVVDAARPAAEILKVVLFVNGQDSLLINERQPFEIHVRVLFHRSPELVDVGLKLTRADGVYVFWQSSGMVGGNVASPLGERTFKFQFPENCLGSGEYAVSASVHNGWKYPENYPYSQILAREINALTFRVLPEWSELDFGVLNQRVPVIVE
jgi:energy-coupling factor transporter ATP-binding protein EcfA2